MTTKTSKKMSPKTKKYLTWGGIALGGYLLYSQLANSSPSFDGGAVKTPPAMPMPPPEPDINLISASQAPYPSTASQYSPVYYPPRPYYPPPAYYPPQPYYPPQTYIPPRTYYSPPQTYVPPVTYPITGYIPPTVTPVITLNSICQSVIGMTVPQARQQLTSRGIYPHVQTVNGRPIATTGIAFPDGVPIADLQSVAGRVVSANCYKSGTSAYSA